MAKRKLRGNATIGGLLAGVMFLGLSAGSPAAYADCTIRIVDNTAISTCPDPNAGTALLGGNDEPPPKIAPPDSNNSNSSDSTDNSGNNGNTANNDNGGNNGNGGDTNQPNGGDINQPAPPNIGGPMPGDSGPLAGASGFDEDDTSSAVTSNRLRSILGPKTGR